MVRKFIVEIISFCGYFSENGDSTVGASALIGDFNKYVALYFAHSKDGCRFPVAYFQRKLSSVAPSILANENGIILDFFKRKFRSEKRSYVTQILKIFFCELDFLNGSIRYRNSWPWSKEAHPSFITTWLWRSPGTKMNHQRLVIPSMENDITRSVVLHMLHNKMFNITTVDSNHIREGLISQVMAFCKVADVNPGLLFIQTSNSK